MPNIEMHSHHDIPGVEFFGKGRGGPYTIPSGYVSPDGVVHNQIYLKEMTGVEDDIFGDSDLIVTERITKVLTNCVEKMGELTDKKLIEAAIGDTLGSLGSTGLAWTAQDRIAAMLYLRIVTLGNIYKFEQRCPRCTTPTGVRRLDLSTIDIKAVKDATKRKVRIVLPRSGLPVVLKVLSAKGEEKVSKLKATQKDVKTLAMIARMESLSDVKLTGTPKDVETVKNLPQADRSYIMNVYQMIEGNIDTDVQVTCKNPGCSIEFEFPLDLGQLFFSSQVEKPTEAELTWL